MTKRRPPKTCRRPDKVPHASEGAAWAALRSLEKAGTVILDMTVYPCAGHWHTGHSEKLFKKRLRRALR